MFFLQRYIIAAQLLFLLHSKCAAETVITAHDSLDWELDWDSEATDEMADVLDWNQHPCRRSCQDGAPPRECHYKFRLEAYHTMSKACFDCPFNATDCSRPHCIPADGVKRSLLVVNRQMPGPSIEVCLGDRIIVDLQNLLPTESTTIHWHGQHHRNTPYMDGVPYVTQCPIPPGATFRYHYIAATVGTHFWHSHSGFQRGDGDFGPLIIRAPPKLNPFREYYDFDEHNMIILDWGHESGTDKFLAHHHSDGDNKPPNLLVNGLGRYKSFENNQGNATMSPLTTYVVKQNFRYRFRLINAEFLNCPIEVTVDNHTMWIISTDGNDIEPIEAHSLVSYAGERFDFLIEMNQDIDNYWIRFRGLMDCDKRFKSAHQVAILRYEGAPDSDPVDDVSYDWQLFNETSRVQINALNQGTETNSTVSMPMLESLEPDDEANTKEPDHQFYISYDFYGKDNPHFHRKDLYGFQKVANTRQKLFTPQLNYISMKLQDFPLLSQRDSIQPGQFCNESSVVGCKTNFCTCTHVLQVKLNSVVELVLVDKGVTYDANHPFHLHGHSFRVVAMERVGPNVTVDQVKKLDADGLIQRKLKRAPIKDTVTVPDGGYTIVRFHANNPGYWLFHCHIEFHVELGMSLIFKVGEHDEFPPVPRDFPRCGSWMPQQPPEILPKETATTMGTAVTTPDTRENDVHQDQQEAIARWLPLIIRELKETTSDAWLLSPPLLPTILCLIWLLIFNNHRR